MFLLVPAYPGCPAQTAVKWLLLYLVPFSGIQRVIGWLCGWLGSRVFSVLDSGAERPGFKSQPRRCRVTVLDKLFTPIVPLFTKQRNCMVAALIRVARVTAGLAESNGSLPPSFVIHVTCRLTARTGISSGKLGNRVWATFLANY